MTDEMPSVEDFYAPSSGRAWGPVKAWLATVPTGEVVRLPENVTSARPRSVANVIKQSAEHQGIARSRVKVLMREDQTWVYIEPEAK